MSHYPFEEFEADLLALQEAGIGPLTATQDEYFGPVLAFLRARYSDNPTFSYRSIRMASTLIYLHAEAENLDLPPADLQPEKTPFHRLLMRALHSVFGNATQEFLSESVTAHHRKVRAYISEADRKEILGWKGDPEAN